LYPCAGTIFQDSRTALQIWFYAIYLFVTTRHGVSGKELERTLGVTYKTAWRMGQQIRQLMAKADVEGMLGGFGHHVEMDEAYVGGRSSGGKRGRGTPNKTIVMAVKERDGFIRAEPIENAKMETLRDFTHRNVKPHTIVSTDEFASYGLLTGDGHWHGTVKHGQKEYANTDEIGVRHHVNSVESFWRLFKASIRGTHVQISKKYADRYLNEFCFRQNYREMQNAMFDVLIAAL
jgi:transposase-like protein